MGKSGESAPSFSVEIQGGVHEQGLYRSVAFFYNDEKDK